MKPKDLAVDEWDFLDEFWKEEFERYRGDLESNEKDSKLFKPRSLN